MAKSDENEVAGLLSRKLNIVFAEHNFDLGEWGKVDKYADLQEDRYLFLEVESSGQKHPCTNVLKVWPYLESNRKASILLAQVFFYGNRNCNSSRANLGCWFGQRLESLLGKRFHYQGLTVSSNRCQVVEGLPELRAALKAWR